MSIETMASDENCEEREVSNAKLEESIEIEEKYAYGCQKKKKTENKGLQFKTIQENNLQKNPSTDSALVICTPFVFVVSGRLLSTRS